MAYQATSESSGNAQNVLLLSLSVLLVNDIQEPQDIEEDDEDDYLEDDEDDYSQDNEEDYEDDSASDHKKSASSVWLYVFIPLWVICLLLNWMLFYVILQDPLAEDPGSTCSWLVTNEPSTVFTAIPISCMGHQILMLILLDLFAIIIYYEHQRATSNVKVVMSRGKATALLMIGMMSSMTIIIFVFVILMIMSYHFHMTMTDGIMIPCLMIISTIMTNKTINREEMIVTV